MKFLSNLFKNIGNLFTSSLNRKKVYVANDESFSSEESASAKNSLTSNTEEQENKLYSLIKAIEGKNREKFLRLIRKDNFYLLGQTDQNGNTILHYLAENPNLTAALDIISLESFDLFTKNNHGKTALDLITENILNDNSYDPQVLVSIGRALIHQVKLSYLENEIPDNFQDLKRQFDEAREKLPNMKSGSVSRNSEPSFSIRNPTLSPSNSVSGINNLSNLHNSLEAFDRISSPKLISKKSHQNLVSQR